MITVLAWLMIIVFLALVMTKKLHPFTALISVPLVFSIAGVFSGTMREPIAKYLETDAADSLSVVDQIIALGQMSQDGLVKSSKTAFMLLFAILFFSIMLNAGLFDPIVNTVIRIAGGDPVKVLVGTAIVAGAVSLNGDGTTTTLICCTAFIPIYKKLNLKMLYLGTLVVLMNTIMNLLPWGGPTARAMAVMEVEGGPVLAALAPGMVVSVIYMLCVAAYLGLKERKRVGIQKFSKSEITQTTQSDPEAEALKRPGLILFNAVLTVATVALLVMDKVPSSFLFLVAFVIGLMVNYRKIREQKDRIQENAGDALQVVILVIAAGMFSGLFGNTGMSDALAQSIVNALPSSLGRWWGLVTAVVSAPGTFFLSNDAYYYGILPVFAEAGAGFGYTALNMTVASLLGQAFHLLSPLVAFIYLLLNLTGLEMGEWQKESAKWAVGIFVIFIAVAGITGACPLFI
ncbi:citrate:proton symporter [Lachnospiraceae bacterium 54-53]